MFETQKNRFSSHENIKTTIINFALPFVMPIFLKTIIMFTKTNWCVPINVIIYLLYKINFECALNMNIDDS